MSRVEKRIDTVNISSIIIVLLGFCMLCVVSTNIAHAQIPPNLILPPHSTPPSPPPPHSTPSSPPPPPHHSTPSSPPPPPHHSTPSSLSPLPPSAKLHAVKIISPSRGQQVIISKNLTVSGISTATGNPATSHCQISVIVNNIKPYHQAKGTGPGGAADFSKWSFVLTSKYTTIKQGPANKITAKYSCSNNPKPSYYSVNVTGVSTLPTASAPHTISSSPTASQPGAHVPVQQRKPVVPNNATNAANTAGIRPPAPIPAGGGGSNYIGSPGSSGKTSSEIEPSHIQKSFNSEFNHGSILRKKSHHQRP
jgi:hypothetical protein